MANYTNNEKLVSKGEAGIATIWHMDVCICICVCCVCMRVCLHVSVCLCMCVCLLVTIIFRVVTSIPSSPLVDIIHGSFHWSDAVLHHI